MHRVWTIVTGVLLLVAFLFFCQLRGTQPAELRGAAKGFVPVWLVVSLANSWVGVHRAGYGVREELPVLAIVSCVPTAITVVAALLFQHG